ncbi:MAG: hypothetical protein ABI317_03205, partial [Gaiellales bacterium]
SDRILTGDTLWSAHVLDRYDARFHPRHIALSDLPATLFHRVSPTLGWPLLLLALAAVVVAVVRRQLEPALAFALALAALLVVQAARGAVTNDDLGRMLTVFALLGTGAGAALLGALPGRLAASAVVVVCVAFVAFPLRTAERAAQQQGRTAARLENQIGPRLAARRPQGLVAVDRAWQGATALYSGLPRRRVVPLEAVGHEVARCAVGARLRVHPPVVSLAYRSCSK